METLPQPTLNIFERLNLWIQESIMVKLVSIGFLVLILLIPASWIEDLIHERQYRADAVMNEVTGKWSKSQTLTGPVLVIPYRKQEVIDRGKEGIEIREHIEKAFFLPENLTINGTVDPEILHRGIFDAVVYRSALTLKSTFTKPDFESLGIANDLVLWKEAHMVMGITDQRGISDNPIFTIGGKALPTEPTNNIGISAKNYGKEIVQEYGEDKVQYEYSSKGILAKLNWENETQFNGTANISLNIKGSKRLDFVPVGKTTRVELSGPWSDPSYDGEFLPENRELTADGFKAQWQVLHFNRPFSQQWKDKEQTLTGAEFGIKLLIPVDQYQKSMRTAKYGQLIILLTFIALFLVEITQKIRIHPFQYILIGAALIIYYTLLLSLSEHFGYNTSYIVASAATTLLISLYAATFLQRLQLSILFALLLSVFYTFIFVIILQQDYSLLIGSIGLFIVVGALMYFSRKINWYRQASSV